jgi:two-component system, NtrC family, nitrogen regulation sensor histidine kinase NtrY
MKKNRLLLASAVSLLAAILLNNYSEAFFSDSHYSRKVSNVLLEKKAKLEEYFQLIEKGGEKEGNTIIRSCRKEGIKILKYSPDSLLFWTSNRIPISKITGRTDTSRVVQFFNSTYYFKQLKIDSIHYVGLIKIFDQYPYTNEFLVSSFEEDFRLPAGAKIAFEKGKGIEIRDSDATWLFSIIMPDKPEKSMPMRTFTSILLFLGLIFFGIYIYTWVKEVCRSAKNEIYLLAIIPLLLSVRILQLLTSLNFKGYLLFNPYLYGESLLVPSLGDLLINSMLILLCALIFVQVFGTEAKTGKWFCRGIPGMIFATLIFFIFFVNAHYFSNSLIFNSSISFYPGAVEQFSVYSLIGFFINGINYLSAGILLFWLLRSMLNNEKIFNFIPVFILTTATAFALLYLIFSYPTDLITLIFFYLFAALAGSLYYLKKDLSAYSTQVLFLLVFSVYSFVFIAAKVKQKELITQKSIILSLANEHDPVAEYLFEDISRQIQSDEYIISQFRKGGIDIDALSDYLKENYFSGFWNKYDMQITICRPQDSVLIETPDYVWFPCYSFFDQILDEMGFNLPDTRFYYLDNLTGRIIYLGKFSFKSLENASEISLFIELDSRLSNDFLGYPELLLDSKLHEDRLIQGYSYAKYYQGKLVSKYGDFSYSLTSGLFGEINKDEYRTVKLDDCSHLLYRSEEDRLIVLSQPEKKFIYLLIGFSYIFLFYYMCLLIYLVVRNVVHFDFRLLRNLRSKIQFSILTILLFSLILIAGSTVWLSLRNYRQSQYDDLKEKVQSVLVELSHKLSNETVLTSSWDDSKYSNLNQLLIKFSDVFYTDINLYDLDGNLLATSRYEIFKLGLQGEKMDPVAFNKLFKEKRAEYIHREKIGELKFLSAYVPFANSEGKELAYLNLPYFTNQQEFQTSLSTLIITIVNIYVILILITIVVTIIISEQITHPLEILQLKFRELKIGRKYEQIQYKRKDEIGGLVEEYNKMVLKLEESVNMLARSERETAWREMAKQVAHEIKNPLTPMRLSVQQLNKMWADKNQDFESYLRSVTETLIEQIDNLSAIASEFSNFAQMPATKLEKVNLTETIEKVVLLFRGDEDVTLELKPAGALLFVNADREQLSRVFINLIKNGIQSIPENRKGKISIDITAGDTMAVVHVADNGRGIPEELKPKLFMPNFTTKSSGMGLGLAIVKNIMDQLGGAIDFETRINKGSRFILKFPLC